jgi:hypothetical protein
MVEPTFQALLMSPTGGTPLLEATNPLADQAAVTLSAITVSANEEEGTAI